ncbi:MAG: hypothetical protein WCJ37_12905 [Syntrophus sp. (in: bacteria)]
MTNHVMMQKAALYVSVKETGIEIELMPAQSYIAEKSAPGRVGAVVCCLVIKEKSRTVFLPEGVKTRYADTFIASAGVLRVSLFEAGEDVDDVMADLIEKYTAAEAVVLQVLLPFDKAWSGAVTEVLNRQGFFFSALIPRWLDADGLMLQRLVHPTNYDNMHIYSDFAKEMLKFII